MSSRYQAGDVLPDFRLKLRTRHIVQGAAASRDWQPLHHDHIWARDTAGTGDIILNTPAQQGWILRYITDSLGPDCRPAGMRLRMKRPLLPDSDLRFVGRIAGLEEDAAAGLCWLCVDVSISSSEVEASEARVLLALPGPVSPWAITPWQPREIPGD